LAPAVGFHDFRQRFTARVFLNFLGRLLRLTRKTKRKVFLIVDGHPVHKARSVRCWLDEHAAQIRIFFLPSYSPELNPDELLNQDVKTNALGRVRPVNVQEMMGNVRSYLRITQARHKLVKNYFRERHVQYAAR
jgi:transposase